MWLAHQCLNLHLVLHGIGDAPGGGRDPVRRSGSIGSLLGPQADVGYIVILWIIIFVPLQVPLGFRMSPQILRQQVGERFPLGARLTPAP